MLAISLETAKSVAIGGMVVFLVGGVAAAWLMKTLLQKLIVAAILALLTFAVWSQRTSLQECADKVQENFNLDGTTASFVDTDCTFFGTTITISDPREPDDA